MWWYYVGYRLREEKKVKPGYAERLCKGQFPALIVIATGRVINLDGETIQGKAKSRSRRLRFLRQAGAVPYGASGQYLILRGPAPSKPRRRKPHDLLNSFGRRIHNW